MLKRLLLASAMLLPLGAHATPFTQDDLKDFLANEGKNQPNMQDGIVGPSIAYCKKYLPPMPGVEEIAKKISDLRLHPTAICG